MNYTTIFLLCLLLILVQLLQFFGQKRQQNLLRAKQSASKTPKHQIMRPKTEKDCPHCRAAVAYGPATVSSCNHSPIPWRQVKSTRGEKQTLRTQNYFCSNEVCAYYLITDQNIHAWWGMASTANMKIFRICSVRLARRSSPVENIACCID